MYFSPLQRFLRASSVSDFPMYIFPEPQKSENGWSDLKTKSFEIVLRGMMKNPAGWRKRSVNTDICFHEILFVTYKHSLMESGLLLQIQGRLKDKSKWKYQHTNIRGRANKRLFFPFLCAFLKTCTIFVYPPTVQKVMSIRTLLESGKRLFLFHNPPFSSTEKSHQKKISLNFLLSCPVEERATWFF